VADEVSNVSAAEWVGWILEQRAFCTCSIGFDERILALGCVDEREDQDEP
jgi:hypothetical protein